MKSRVHNPKYLEKYFTQFPNIIDDSELTPFEYRLLIHYYRVGECWEGVRKTSQICKMSVGKVAGCRKSLEERGFVSIQEKGDGIIITLVDLSVQNLEKYNIPSVHGVNSSVHGVNSRCSPGEHKKNQFKKNQLGIHDESKDSLHQEAVLVNEITIDNKPKEKGKNPVFVACKNHWLDELHPDWTFKPIDGMAVKGIITQMRSYSAKKNEVDPTDESLVDFFRHFCRSLPEFYKNQTLAVLNSKFDSIISEIKSGKRITSKPTTRDIINSL